MRTRLPLALVACLFTLAGAMDPGLADQKTPTNDPNWTPPVYLGNAPQHLDASMLINDGSFENGPPPGSSWTEGSSTEALCEWIVDPSAVFAIAAYDGALVFWAGGYCPLGVANIDSVSQTIHIPGDADKLSFWIWGDRGDPDDEGQDLALVAINGTYLWQRALSQANNTPWINQQIDISSYAGQNVELRLAGHGVGLTGNLLFDFFEIISRVTAAQSRSWGAIKTIYR